MAIPMPDPQGPRVQFLQDPEEALQNMVVLEPGPYQRVPLGPDTDTVPVRIWTTTQPRRTLKHTVGV